MLLLFPHKNAKQLVHVLLCSFFHVQRSYLVIINRAFFQHPEKVHAVLKDLVLRHQIAEVLSHLNDDLLDGEQYDLFLVSVMTIHGAFKHGFKQQSWPEYFGFCCLWC